MADKEDWKEAAIKIFDWEKIGPVLLIVGVLIGVLAGVGTWPYPRIEISERGQVILAIVAALSFSSGFLPRFKRKSQGQTDLSRCNFKIDNIGAVVKVRDSKFDFHGTFDNEPPAGFRPFILEMEGQGRFRPRKYVDLNEKQKSWQADDVWVGAPGSKRTMAIAIAGPTSIALLNYFEKVGQTYKFNNRPSIDDLPPDIYICQQKTIAIQ